MVFNYNLFTNGRGRTFYPFKVIFNVIERLVPVLACVVAAVASRSLS